jgi:hypothetical protein
MMIKSSRHFLNAAQIPHTYGFDVKMPLLEMSLVIISRVGELSICIAQVLAENSRMMSSLMRMWVSLLHQCIPYLQPVSIKAQRTFS